MEFRPAISKQFFTLLVHVFRFQQAYLASHRITSGLRNANLGLLDNLFQLHQGQGADLRRHAQMTLFMMFQLGFVDQDVLAELRVPNPRFQEWLVQTLGQRDSDVKIGF